MFSTNNQTLTQVHVDVIGSLPVHIMSRMLELANPL